MNARDIFDAMESRIKNLEKMIDAKIEGNCEGNEYMYSEEDRIGMKKELRVLEDTMFYMDAKIYKYMICK